MTDRIVTMALASLAALIPALTSTAQDATSVMVTRDDAGDTRVRRISMPNLELLRTPDFTRKDLPIFIERLVLSEAQGESIGRRIDAYVEEFMTLARDLTLTSGPGAELRAVNPQEEPPAGPRIGFGPGAMGPGSRGAFDDLEEQLPPGSQVNVGISIGINPEAEDPQPSAQVELGIETPDDEDVSPELLEKFQARADELAAQMAQQVAEQQAAQADGRRPDGAGEPGQPRLIIADPEEMEQKHAELLAKIEEFRKQKAALRNRFVTEAQGDLAQGQIDRWPSLERALTRERSLPKGRLSGESTDLTKVLAEQKLSESATMTIAESVESYELELDGALKRRDSFLEDANQRIDEAVSTGDADKAIAIAEKAAEFRIAVRRINAQYAERIAAELAGDEGSAFRSAAMLAFYPRLYGVTRGQKMFAAFDRLEDVPQDAATAVAEVRTSYEQEHSTVTEHIRQVIDREEPREPIRGLEHLQRTMRGENMARDDDGEPRLDEPENPIKDAYERRAELDDRCLKLVASMLPPELASQLPGPRTRKGPIVIRSGK